MADPATLLRQGHLFLGAMGGEIWLRRVAVTSPASQGPAQGLHDGAVTIKPVQAAPPRVSIVTTVYDRLDCLRQCIASVRRLRFSDYEHLIISDAPPPDVVQRIADLVQTTDDPRLAYLNLAQRHNNWGIAPAVCGLRRARGEYLCFLSDDNGYQPGHVGTLVALLDRQAGLGFAYRSCDYAGRTVLRHPVPRAARIDLGQPMFRRELFERHFNDDLPFNEMAWDWRLIEALMQRSRRSHALGPGAAVAGRRCRAGVMEVAWRQPHSWRRRRRHQRAGRGIGRRRGRAQVSGVLQQLSFKKGQQAKAGQLLAQSDPRALQASLAQAALLRGAQGFYVYASAASARRCRPSRPRSSRP